eukprot:1899514-Pleurochrysis_carterae.AAC.1
MRPSSSTRAARRVIIALSAAVCLAVAGIASFVHAVAVSAAYLLLPTAASPPALAPARPHHERGRRA